MNNRIINLIIAAPVTLVLMLAILYKVCPEVPAWGASMYSVLILVIAERAGYIYDHFKAEKS